MIDSLELFQPYSYQGNLVCVMSTAGQDSVCYFVLKEVKELDEERCTVKCRYADFTDFKEKASRVNVKNEKLFDALYGLRLIGMRKVTAWEADWEGLRAWTEMALIE